MALTALALSACAPAGGDSTPGAEAAEAASPDQAAGGSPAARVRPAPGRAWVIFGADTVVAEVARTPEQRAEGLMYRQELPDGTGMLFVFEENEVRSFWMQNTYVALDIAFLDPGFTIVDIQQMAPMTTENHDSTAPAMFALEVRQGWFAERGIAVGARAQVVFGIQ
jgi:hypothetical protein